MLLLDCFIDEISEAKGDSYLAFSSLKRTKTYRELNKYGYFNELILSLHQSSYLKLLDNQPKPFRYIFKQYYKKIIYGQQISILQKDGFSKNYNWYINSVIPNKTIPSVAVVIAGMLHKKDDINKLRLILKEISYLNTTYGIWQIQDDIVDIEKDLSKGILGAPVYYYLQNASRAEQSYFIKQYNKNNIPGCINSIFSSKAIRDLAIKKLPKKYISSNRKYKTFTLFFLFYVIEYKMRKSAIKSFNLCNHSR